MDSVTYAVVAADQLVMLDEVVRGVPRAWLLTHETAPARRLYESAGWRPITTVTSADDVQLIIYGTGNPGPL